MSKSLIFLVKLFLGYFYKHLATFYWSHWTSHLNSFVSFSVGDVSLQKLIFGHFSLGRDVSVISVDVVAAFVVFLR